MSKLGCIFSALVLISCSGSATVGTSTPKTATATQALASRPEKAEKIGFTANVMMPLYLRNDAEWNAARSQLSTVAGYGVNAASVDIWWGLVEGKADNQFDWSYYDSVFKMIQERGLRIVPVLSFHQCGGNVGDDCNVPLPPWLWGKYAKQKIGNVQIGVDGLKYKSEQGHFSSESVQLWADQVVLQEYTELVKDFVLHFANTYARDVQEITVSLGPAGELRYPSYNAHDEGTGYPTRGALQASSELALEDFRNKMLAPEKYGALDKVNAAWSLSLTSRDQIYTPQDRDRFFTSGAYRKSTYGKDFVDWYNQSLVDHGKRVLTAVADALGGAFPSASLGYKVPGVHWAMTHPQYARAAEVAAGLVQTSIDLDADASGHGYSKVVAVAKETSVAGRQLNLHFTCLEMDDQPGAEAYSQAKSLVLWVAQEAYRRQVVIKGENALAGGVQSEAGWKNIFNAFDRASYSGLTVLRVNDVSAGVGQAEYSRFIQRYRPKL